MLAVVQYASPLYYNSSSTVLIQRFCLHYFVEADWLRVMYFLFCKSNLFIVFPANKRTLLTHLLFLHTLGFLLPPCFSAERLYMLYNLYAKIFVKLCTYFRL